MNNNAGLDLTATRYSFNEYWKGRKEAKGTGIKVFKICDWFWDQRLAPNQPLPKRSIAWEEWSRYQNNTASRTLNTQAAAWTFAGPGSTQSGYYGIGRLNTIAFHPTDANTFYVGTPAGGL